jgi:hypothetical protein
MAVLLIQHLIFIPAVGTAEWRSKLSSRLRIYLAAPSLIHLVLTYEDRSSATTWPRRFVDQKNRCVSPSQYLPQMLTPQLESLFSHGGATQEEQPRVELK